MMLNYGNLTDGAYSLAFHWTKVVTAVKLKATAGAFVSEYFQSKTYFDFHEQYGGCLRKAEDAYPTGAPGPCS